MLSETDIAVAAVSNETRDVYAARVARQSAGWALILCSIVLVVSAVFSDELPANALAWELLLSWPIALCVYAVAHAGSSILFRDELANAVAQESNRTQGGEVALTALVRLRARALVEPRERSSFTALMVGSALLGPLTVHALAVAVAATNMTKFSSWILGCVVLTGHAHLAFAAGAARYARKLSQHGSTSLAQGVSCGLVGTVIVTAILSAIPGVFVYGLPPLLALCTCIVVTQFFRHARTVVIQERRMIESNCLPAKDDLTPETFDEIRSVAEWRRGAPDVRALAVRALAERFSRARVGPVLDRVIESSPGFVRDSALEVALAIRHRPPLDLLLSALDFASARTTRLIAGSLQWHHSARVEPALVSLLAQDAREVRIAAIEALGRAGTRTAVEPLLRIAEGIYAPELRGAARASIDLIQARIGDTGRGELSLVAVDDRGALSIPEGNAGEVSIVQS